MNWLLDALWKAVKMVLPIPPPPPHPVTPKEAYEDLKEQIDRDKPDEDKLDRDGEHKVIVNVIDIKF